MPQKVITKLGKTEFETFFQFEDQFWEVLSKEDDYSKIERSKYKVYHVKPLYKTLDPFDLDNMIIATEEYYNSEIEPVSQLGI